MRILLGDMAKRTHTPSRIFESRSLPPPVRAALGRRGLAVQHFPRFRSAPDIAAHGHEFVEMVYLVSGRLRHRLETTVADDSPGTLSIVHYHQRHSLEAPAGSADLYNIYVDLRRHRLPSLPDGLGRDLAALLPLHPALGYRPPGVVRMQMPRPNVLAGYLAAMEAEQQSDQPGSQAALASLSRLFWLECGRTARDSGLEPSDVPDDPAATRAERARRLLDAQPQKPWTLDELAGGVGVSKSYLSRSFRGYTGQTVMGYLTGRRIERAMLLLQTTDRKVLDIALDCGFGDLSHFIRTFRRRVGATPTRYRRDR
jgi:AraC-like DNA-binding protein